MIILVFIMSFLIMNIINKWILKEKNLGLSIGISIFSLLIYFKYGYEIEFWKFILLAFVLAVVGWIDFKTQDVYTSHIIVGCLIGIAFLGFEFVKSNGFSKAIIPFLVFLIGVIVIGLLDVYMEEKWIYIGTLSIYVLYFFIKGDLNLLNSFSAMVLPSLIIGALALMGGMGWGDVEIIFMCGLFLNFKMAMVNLFIGILLGGIYSIYLIIFKKKQGKTAIAFGPYIAMGTGITVLFGEQILNWYINFI